MFYIKKTRSRLNKLEEENIYLNKVIKEMQKQFSREFTVIYARINEIENYINEQIDEVVFPN